MEKSKNDSKIELESNSKIIANNKFIAKKRKKSTIYKKFKNPGINHFNINSFFIYDLGKIQSIIYSIKDKNNMKMSDKDINSLSEEINKYSANIQLNKNEYDIKISEEDYYSINDYFSCQQNDNDLVSWLNKKINENDTRQKISCRKLSKIYEKEKGKKISLSYIYYNLKNKLHLHYLKTSIKKKVTMSRNSIFLCHCFLKIISRAISMGYDILFLDESSILSHNNNFRCWRKSNEQIYLNYDTEKRSNLLLIINKEKVIYYKINRKNTNEETFLEPDVNSQKCIDCENTIQKPMVLKVDQYRIPLFEGQRIYNIQLPIDGSLNAVVGEVVKNSVTGKLGIKNYSSFTWQAIDPIGTAHNVSPESGMPIKNEMKIKFKMGINGLIVK